ncbi:MAG TPA: hypothetical protein VK638_02970 [Edaphobacter sp.]|nr:hypothetical protein [Edaphobacter sp.]
MLRRMYPVQSTSALQVRVLDCRRCASEPLVYRKSDSLSSIADAVHGARCPNIRPAYEQLQSLGFKHINVLYLANNFGSDWVDKGYPVAKGR